MKFKIPRLTHNKTKHNFYITSIGNGVALGNAFDRVASWKRVVNLWRRGREIKSQKEKRVLSKAGKSPSSYRGRTSPRLVKACPIRFYKCAFPFTFSIFTRLGRFIYRMHNQCLFLLFFFPFCILVSFQSNKTQISLFFIILNIRISLSKYLIVASS